MGLLDKFKKTDADIETDFKEALNKCNTLDEMFEVIRKFYKTETKISPMLKPITVKTIAEKITFITKFLSIKER
jgi:hypothetical protein